MIIRNVLAEDILEIEYFKLLSKFQHYILECMKNGIFIDRNEANKNIFVKKSGSKKCGKQGLIECYNYILNKYFIEKERIDLEKNLKRYNIPRNKLVYDLSTKNLEMIGCEYSKNCFKYYNGAGYTLKLDKNIPLYYNNPKQQNIYKKLYDLDNIVNNLNSECRNYYDSSLKSIKFNDDLLDSKLEQLKDFLNFLKLDIKEKSYLLGRILTEDEELKNDSIFLDYD